MREGNSNIKYISGIAQYLVNSDDEILNVDSTAMPITIILPNIKDWQLLFAKPKKVITVNDAGGNASINTITIIANNNNINGLGSLLLDADKDTATFSPVDNNEWFGDKQPSGGGGMTSANNGLTINATIVQLGGGMIIPTVITATGVNYLQLDDDLGKVWETRSPDGNVSWLTYNMNDSFVTSSNCTSFLSGNNTFIDASGIFSAGDNCIYNDFANGFTIGHLNEVYSSSNVYNLGSNNISTSVIRIKILGSQNDLSAVTDTFIVGNQNTLSNINDATIIGILNSYSNVNDILIFGNNNKNLVVEGATGYVTIGTYATGATSMLTIKPVGSGTIGITINTTSTQDSIISLSTNNSATTRGKIWVNNSTQSFNFYTTNNDTIFWNGAGSSQTKTLTLFTNTTAKFENYLYVGTGITLDGLDIGFFPVSIVSTNATLTRMRLQNQGAVQTDIQVANSGGSNSLYLQVLSTGEGAIDNRTSGALFFMNGGTTHMTFNGVGKLGIGITPVARLDILASNAENILRLNSLVSQAAFYSALIISNDGSFQTGSGISGSGSGTFTADHLTYTFRTSYQTYFAFSNNQGTGNRGGYGIIGAPLASANNTYRLSLLNNDTGTLGNNLWIGSTAAYSTNDAFDYFSYGISITSGGIQTNTGAGIAYKVGINIDVTNGDINRAINIENGVIRVVKANQPLYATLTSGEFYYDTSANILANGDFVVGMKA